MKNGERYQQHSLQQSPAASLLRICWKLCPQPMTIRVSDARCTMVQRFCGWLSVMAVSVEVEWFSPWLTWQVAKLCRDVRWDVKEFTHHLPKAFFLGEGEWCEEVGVGVHLRLASSQFHHAPFFSSKITVANLLSGKAHQTQPTPGNLPSILSLTYTNHFILSFWMLKLPAVQDETPKPYMRKG